MGCRHGFRRPFPCAPTPISPWRSPDPRLPHPYPRATPGRFRPRHGGAMRRHAAPRYATRARFEPAPAPDSACVLPGPAFPTGQLASLSVGGQTWAADFRPRVRGASSARQARPDRACPSPCLAASREASSPRAAASRCTGAVVTPSLGPELAGAGRSRVVRPHVASADRGGPGRCRALRAHPMSWPRRRGRRESERPVGPGGRGATPSRLVLGESRRQLGNPPPVPLEKLAVRCGASGSTISGRGARCGAVRYTTYRGFGRCAASRPHSGGPASDGAAGCPRSIRGPKSEHVARRG